MASFTFLYTKNDAKTTVISVHILRMHLKLEPFTKMWKALFRVEG